MNYCAKCVLPDTFPGITFDEGGVCNYCRNTPIPTGEEKHEHLQRFEALMERSAHPIGFDVAPGL